MTRNDILPGRASSVRGEASLLPDLSQRRFPRRPQCKCCESVTFGARIAPSLWRVLILAINRRGAEWWEGAIRKGSRISILAFGDTIAGYANYGRNRARSLAYDGEIYELYLRPEFQGLGFGRRLFAAARRDLTQSGIKSMVVWALSDNAPAVAFYRALGGRPVARSCEKFGDKTLDKIAYAWSA